MLKSIYIIFAMVFFIAEDSYSSQANTLWSCPENYPYLFEKATEGDKLAQEEICKLIYKGVIRYPDTDKDNDFYNFKWLNETISGDSFERRVAHFFFNYGEVEDAEKIINEIEKKAKEGDIYAQRSKGSLYFYTELFKDNREAGVEWYRKAANKGHARAQMSLALRYLDGMHIEKDIIEGMKWLRKAANAGLPEALGTLADFYHIGKHVDKDINKSYELTLAASKAGETYSQGKLAYHHLGKLKDEYPANKDPKEGIRWMRIAAESGDLDAIYTYGAWLFVGYQMEKNTNKGTQLIKKAAKHGHKAARSFLK